MMVIITSLLFNLQNFQTLFFGNLIIYFFIKDEQKMYRVYCHYLIRVRTLPLFQR